MWSSLALVITAILAAEATSNESQINPRPKLRQCDQMIYIVWPFSFTFVKFSLKSAA